jgi:hypothetical protein
MVHDDKTAALERLDAELPRERYATTLTYGTGHEPRLCVVNRDLPALAGDVYVDRGWFWWPWAERIAVVTGPAEAAAKVMQVLGAVDAG